MFEQTFVSSRETARRPWPVAASLALQTAFVAAVLAVPLFQKVAVVWRPPAPIVFAPLKPKVVEPVLTEVAGKPAVDLRPVFRPTFVAPVRIPAKMATDAGPEPMAFLPEGVGKGYSDPLAGFAAGIPVAQEARVQDTAAAGTVKKIAMVRVGTGVQAAKLIRQMKPVYPPLARTARMSGTVRLQAIIATDGRIRNLQLIGGPPLLVEAALLAVKQWQYEPTLLNGEPVEVITSIEVNFTLNQ